MTLIASLEQCYQIADAMDGEDSPARSAINFAGYTAQMYRRHIKALAWACQEKNARKRANALQSALMELEANNENIADLPMPQYGEQV